MMCCVMCVCVFLLWNLVHRNLNEEEGNRQIISSYVV